jgi:hypothetical protein
MASDGGDSDGDDIGGVGYISRLEVENFKCVLRAPRCMPWHAARCRLRSACVDWRTPA